MKQEDVKVVVRKMVKAGESAKTIESFIKEAAKRNSLGKKKNSTTRATVESPLAQRISDLPSENTSSESVNQTSIYMPRVVPLHDAQKYGTYDWDEYQRLLKEEEEKDRITREKFNKQINIEEQVELGDITQEEADVKINNLNEIYDNSKNQDELYYNKKKNKIKNSNVSEETKTRLTISLDEEQELYNYEKQNPTVSFATADKNKDGIIDVTEQFFSNSLRTKKEDNNNLFNSYLEKAIEKEEEEKEEKGNEEYEILNRGEFTPSPTGGGVYEDGTIVDSSGNIISEAEEDILEDDELLNNLLTAYYVQIYADENEMTYDEAKKVYIPSNEGLIDYRNLTNGTIPIDVVEKIKQLYVDIKSRNDARDLTQQKLNKEYENITSFWTPGGREQKQIEDLKKTRINIRNVNEEIKKVTTKTDILNGFYEKNKERYDVILKEVEETPTGTVTVDGEVLKDEDGKDIKFPHAAKIQVLIDENKKLVKGNYTTQEQVNEANLKIKENQEKINQYISNHQDNIENLNGYANSLQDIDLMINDQLNKTEIETDNLDDYKSLLEVQDNRYGGGSRIAREVVFTGFGSLAVAADEIVLEIKDLTGIKGGSFLFTPGLMELENSGAKSGILPKIYRDYLDFHMEEHQRQMNKKFTYYDASELNSFADVAGHTCELIAGMAPMLIATVASGGTAGLAVAGVTAFGGDLERTRKLQERHPDLYNFTRSQRYLSAVIHGTLEVATERLLVGKIGRVSNKMALDNTFQSGVKSWLTTSLNIGTRTALEMGQEGFGEGVNMFGQNFTSKYLLGMDDINLMDGVTSAFVDGMLVSGGISTPMILKNTTDHLMPDRTKKTLSENAFKIQELSEMLNSNPDLSSEVRSDLFQQIDDLVNTNMEIQDNQLKGAVGYTAQDKQDLIDISNKKHEVEKRVKNIRKDKSLTTEQKQNLIEKQKVEFDKLNKKKQDIINKDKRTDEEKQRDYDAYVESVRKMEQEYYEKTGKRVEIKELTKEEVETKFNEDNLRDNAYYQSEIDGAQNQLDNNIDKQEFLFDNQGNLTEQKNPNYGKQLTPERKAQLESIIEQGTDLINQNLQQSQGDASQFGFISQDPRTGEQTVYINKETSLAKGGRITTAAHEFLHAVLFKTIGRDANIQARLGNALTKFINKKGGVNQEFLDRMSPYVGETNMGEEMITVMSESILDGTLKFDEGFFTQVGDVLRRFLQKNGFTKIRFNNGRQVYNFIKDYNDSIEKNYTNKAIMDVMAEGAKGRLVSGPKRSGAGISYSKANALQQMYETTYKGDKVKLVEEGLSIDKNGNKVKDTELHKSILGEAMGKIAGRITKRLFDPIPLSQRAGITHEIYMNEVLKLGGEMIKNEYDPTRQSLDRFVSNRLNLRAESLAKKIGVKQEFTEDISDPKVGKQLKVDPVDFDAPKYETIDGKPTVADKLVKVDPELQPVMDEMRANIDNGLEMLLSNEGMLLELKDPNLDPQIRKSYEQQIEANNAELEILGMKDFDITKQNYKSLKDLNPEITQKMFGIIPKPGVLTAKDDVPNAQRFIDRHADVLAGALPQGFVASTSKSTGVQKVLLDEFYNKRSIRAGTAAGEFVQHKKPMPAIMKTFRSLFGITERGQQNLVLKETNVSSRIKAIVAQTGKVISNQMVREYLEKSGNVDARIMIAISEGKSDLQFSKGKTLNKISEGDPAKGAAISIALFDTTVNKMKKYNGNMKNFANDQLIPLVDDKVLTMKEIEKIGEDLQGMYDLIVPSYIATETVPLEAFVVDKYFSTIEGRVGYASMLSDMTGETFVNVKGNKLAQEQGRAAIKTLANKLDAKYGPGFSAKYLLPFIAAPSKIQDGEFIPDPKNRLKLIKNPKWTPYKTWNQKDIDEGKAPKGAVAGVTPKLNKKGKRSPQDNRQGFATGVADAAFLCNAKVDAKGNVIQDFGEHGTYPDGYSAYMKGNLETVPTAKQRTAFIKQQTENNAAYRKVQDMLRESYQDKTITGNQVVSILANMNANQRGLTRASAILDFIPAESKNYKNDKLVLEHMTPALAINLFALRYILSSNNTAVNARKDLHDALDNYRLAYLPHSYDKIVNKFYKSTMPFYWSPTSTSLLRYYNAEMGGAFDLQMTQLSTGIIVGPDLVTDKNLMNKVIKGQLDAVSGLLKVKVTEKQLEGISFSKAAKITKDAQMTSSTVNPEKGISIWDFDDTLAESKSNVLFTKPDGTTGKLTAEEFAKQGADLLAKGYVYDFSEFSQVVEGQPGPLFQDFVDRIKKFGVKDNFILTARPENSDVAIQAFLKEFGLDIPIENITGLANSTPEAKALWIAEKVGEGYNNIYFADDALANVQVVKNVLEQFDIKSDVVQAKYQFSKQMSPEFNNILDSKVLPELDLNRIIEQSTGVKAEAEFSQAQAKIRGSKKGKFGFFVPPSAEDFKGLIYRFLAKGRIGEQQMAFFKKALFDPFARGYTSLNKAKQNLNSGYRLLLKNFPSVKNDLNLKLDSFEGYDGNQFTVDQAVRVYLWNKNGMEVPGLSKRDLKTLVDFVESDQPLKSFADSLQQLVSLEQGYTTPNDYWLVESTQSDIQSINNEVSRQEHLAEFIQNRSIMFGEWQGTKLVGPNMNKIEAIYGTNFRDALEDILYRMEFGSKREGGKNKLVNRFNNWANQSVGAIMFFNMRSALLQTISSVNYINWSDNNPLKAAMAFANQPQFWKDFAMIFNSDMLKLRRAGNQRGINEAELAQAVAGSKNKAKAALNWLLTKGFLPTQIADSFAIASGGATFYRNRVNALMKQGLTQKEAEARAFKDFQEVTEESQQSSRPDLISQQQASPLGRYILAFKNTPMQYARLMKKSIIDLANGRGDAKTHISKIIYYGMVQNLIFNGLQAALGALIGDDDEEKEAETQTRIIHGMIDSILSGLGFGGNIVMTVKNTIREYLKQRKRNWNADHTYTILKIIGLSPTIGSKLRKIYSAIQTEKFNREVINEMSYFDFDNPIYEAIANVVSGATNLPLDRLIKKVNNVDAAITEDISALERLALLMGWNTWDLGIKDQDIIAVEEEIKEKKDIERKEKKEIKKIEKKKKEEEEELQKEEENKIIQQKEKEEGKEVICIAISKKGTRCKNKVEPGKSYCTIHAKVEQGTEEVQCKKIKSNKERCKMKTKAKSGLCYYHD